MQMRRGLERRSCDLCYRRKIQCDRWTRGTEVVDKCSQCVLREAPCTLDDSHDIRIRRRRTENLRSGISSSYPQQRQQVTSIVRESDLQMFNVGFVENTYPPTSTYGRVGLSPSQNSATPSSATSVPLVPSLEVDTGTASYSSTNDFTFPDVLFELSSDTASFLDQTFMWKDDLLEGSNTLVTTEGQSEPSVEDQTPEMTQDEMASISVIGPFDDAGRKDAYWVANVASTVLDAAIPGYFDSVALCLPILFEDAFWHDYNAGQCSAALVFAIVCHGIPFTTVEDKWQLQQQIARRFREAFLQAQHMASVRGMPRLDDLEALALMINFEFDDAQSLPMDSRLENLFLTHDALVLTTLQSRNHNFTSSSQTSWTLLTRADERRTLLFWHVYGLDAFHSLDCKKISRIQENSAEFMEQVLPHRVGGYLDAVLTLAIVARRILHLLCSARVKKEGVRIDDVQSLYQDLYHWRETSYPSHLR